MRRPQLDPLVKRVLVVLHPIELEEGLVAELPLGYVARRELFLGRGSRCYSNRGHLLLLRLLQGEGRAR